MTTHTTNKPAPLGPVQQRALRLIEARPRDVSELANHLLMAPSSVYQLVESLLRRNLVHLGWDKIEIGPET